MSNRAAFLLFFVFLSPCVCTPRLLAQTIPYSRITGKPTTVSGFGITDAVTLTTAQTLTNKTLTSPVINSGSLGSSTIANTQSAGDNSTKVATTAYADAKVADAINDGTTGMAPSQNAVYDALALKAPLSLTINDQTASYTLVLSDAGKLVRQNVASANNLTVPLNSSVAFPVGTQITVSQLGAGQVTFVATGGVTIHSAGAALKLRVQYSAGTLIKTATDTWLLIGDISN